MLRNDTDVDSPTLTVELADAPTRGTLDLRPDGSFTYVPSAGFAGRDVFHLSRLRLADPDRSDRRQS